MTLAALDPWTFEFGDLNDERLSAMEAFLTLMDEHPDLEIMPFIDLHYDAWLYGKLAIEDPDEAINPFPIQDIEGQIGRFRCGEQLDEVTDADDWGERPALRRWWLEVLAALDGDESERWRDPVLLVPRARCGVSPGTEVELGSVQRLLVVLEEPDANELFLRDFDPWKCERARSSDQDRVPRDLPRPSICDDVGMAQWVPLLDALSDSVAQRPEKLYFLPPFKWAPLRVSKSDWRHCPFGKHGSKPKGDSARSRYSGPVDRRGRIWHWDGATHKTHWDVQHEDPKTHDRMNVRIDGVITQHYTK